MLALLLLLAQPGLLTPQPHQYEMVELELIPSTPPNNPFDPNEITVDAIVTLPSHRTLRVPGFWYQPYQRNLKDPAAIANQREEQLTPAGPPAWRIRFASPEAGLHTVVLELKDHESTTRSAPVTVRVQPGPRPGYIRTSPRNPHYLEHETGQPFFPIGENLCMYQKREGTYYFDRLLPKLAANGANYARIWQEYYPPKDITILAGPGDAEFSGFPLETHATGLGRYDLASAWRLDHVATTCERLGVYWQLTFEMTVWWNPRFAHRWPRNPYNAANGGPCAKPSDYFTNPKARELVRRRLRYSVARWGWSTHLAAWELWNEVDNNDGFDCAANAVWHREMAAYLKSIDPARHPITTSWRDPAMFALPEIDIVQAHSYWEATYDAAQYALQDTDHLMRPYGKPFFFGEQGVEDPALAMKIDPEGHHFHDALWASTLSGAAGTGLYWWWHNYVESNNLYRHYQPLARFLQGTDWPAHQWKQTGLARPNLPVTLQVYGLAANDRAFLWLHDPLAFRVIDRKPVEGPDQPHASVNITGLTDGEYAIEWWDTLQGRVLRTDRATVQHLHHFGYGLELTPPPFRGDIAARITPAQR